jgi:hypothetical protein
MDANFRLHRTQQDVKQTMSLSAEVGLIGGMFSSSASYKQFQIHRNSLLKLKHFFQLLVLILHLIMLSI